MDACFIMATKSLTNSQEIVLSVLYVLSSILSILGSSTIVYKVLGDRSKATSYDRLMLGLSICDIIASVGWALTPFLLPRETSTNPWAIGNDTTCTFLGFITQLGFSAVLYNMFLSFYYLLTVRYGVKRENFSRNYEQWIHGFVIVYGITTATVGATFGIFSEVQVGLTCWVNDYPRGCVDEECISDELGWSFGGGPIVSTVISLAVNNILVYLHVRRSFHSTSGTAAGMRQSLQKKEVAQQGLWYVASFVFCFWATVVVRGMEGLSATSTEESIEGQIYWLLVIQAATLPFQGFLNMFVYNRPNYSRLRAAYPDLSWVAAARMACFDRRIPRLQEITWSASEPKSYSRYKDRSSSGSGFHSDLAKISEEGESDDGTRLDGDVGLGSTSMIASSGETNDDEVPDTDGTHESLRSCSIRSVRGEGIVGEIALAIRDTDADRGGIRSSISEGVPAIHEGRVSMMANKAKRVSMDGFIVDVFDENSGNRLQN